MRLSFGGESHETRQRGPHPHYQQNLRYAEKFIEELTSLPQGLSIRLGNSEGLFRCLVTIAYVPPEGAPYPAGATAVPLFLHCENITFKNQLHANWEHFLSLARKKNTMVK